MDKIVKKVDSKINYFLLKNQRALGKLGRAVFKIKNFLLINWYRKHKFDKTLPIDTTISKHSRTDIINHAFKITQAHNYLEIGCADDDNFKLIDCTNKVGVDPVCGGNCRMTADQFFMKNKQIFDVIFIDGLHIYEQVHRDIANSLKTLSPGGFIIIHDMLPSDWKIEHVPYIQYQKTWYGDVWKTGFEIQAGSNLQFKIAIADSGVGIIKLGKSQGYIKDLSAEISEQRFPYFYENHKKLPLIESEKALQWMQTISSV